MTDEKITSRQWLKPRELLVLRLQYENNLTQLEISRLMSISTTRVGQLRAKSVTIIQAWADSQEGNLSRQPFHAIVQAFLQVHPDGGLFLALKGICKGHLCDACDVCQSGHCCRQDNPDYKLPETGSYGEPIYGTLGKVERDQSGRVYCHICGNIYSSLQAHVWHRHDLTIPEYKALFGLNRTTALISEDLRDICSASAWKRYLTTDFVEKGEEARLRRSAEPDFYHVKGLRLEAKQHLSEMRGGKRVIRCLICGDLHPTYKRTQKVCQKPECFAELQSRLQKARLSRNPEWRAKLGSPGEPKLPKIESLCPYCQTSYLTSQKRPKRTCGKDECLKAMQSEIARRAGLGTEIRRKGHWRKDRTAVAEAISGDD